MKYSNYSQKYWEDRYILAQHKYYEGAPIMSDADFDDMEDYLKSLGSDIIKKIGAPKKKLTTLFDDTESKRRKDFHITPLLSLHKIKAEINTEPPVEDALKWFKKVGVNILESTPKYDGNSVNVIYDENNQLIMALSRGDDGKEGSDITSKLIRQLPHEIEIYGHPVWRTEIRGEVLIPVSVFDEKYRYSTDGGKDKSNPRNFVAGALNPTNSNTSMLGDLHFVPYEVRLINQKGEWVHPSNTFKFLQDNGFKYLPHILLMRPYAHSFIDTFNYWLNFRENLSIYQLDGFVLKVLDMNRIIELGENEHDPNWAIAVKFESIGTRTEIIDIDWRIGKTGAYTPVAILTPVDLEGSVVRQASMHNVGYVIENNLYPGAIVEIAKKGDIIPQVNKIIKPSDNPYDIPNICPYCQHKLFITTSDKDKKQLMCLNDDCRGKNLEQFIYGVKVLDLEFFGEASIEKIFDIGIESAFDLFDKNKFNRQNLIMAGFADGKYIDKMMNSLDKITSLTLEQCLMMLGITGLGKSISKELAKKLAKVSYSDHGLTKKYFTMFETDTPEKRMLVKGLTTLLENGINVIKPSAPSSIKVKKYCCTGSPSKFGFKHKSDFDAFAAQFGFEPVEDLDKDCALLITNDINATSGKMLKAEQWGIPIMTYDKFVETYGN